MKKIIWALLFAIPLSSLLFVFVSAESHFSIHIIKPGDRRNVPIGDSPVVVEIRGAAPASSFYWELYEDQLLVETVRADTSTAAVSFLRTGPHAIQVMLLDPQGNRVASDEILVIAAPVEARTPLFNREWFAPAMAVLVLTIGSITGFSIWYSRRRRKRHFENEQANQAAVIENESPRVKSL